MALDSGKNDGFEVQTHEEAHDHEHRHHHTEMKVVPLVESATVDVVHINLTWRSWIIVFINAWAGGSQVFVVTAAGSVIAFINRDLGETALSGWIIQAPLLMQSVLSPLVGRLSDVYDRKWIATIPPLIACAGAIISAKATSIDMLIAGHILIGCTLATVAIVHSIPSEIMPLKYRPIANGLCSSGGTIGGLVAGLGAGAVTNIGRGGWRWIYWIQAILHGVTALGFIIFYWPPKKERPKYTFREFLWMCDPIGSLLFTAGSALTLLGFNFAGGKYDWSDAEVIAPLTVGLVCLAAFGVYNWLGRTDGLIAHVFFAGNANFFYSVFAFSVEGWIYYSAVNSIVPQIILQLGFEDNSWDISVRQLSFQCTILTMPLILSAYASYFKDLKNPLLVTWTFFLAVCIFYAQIKPSWNKAQLAINVICGIGQAGPLVLLPAAVQFATPHEYISTATGLAFSARAIGGAMGSAVLNAIINGRIASHYEPAIRAATVSLGLPESSLPGVIKGLASGVYSGVAGATPQIWDAAIEAHKWEHAKAFSLAWASIIPFVVLAVVCTWLMKPVKELMTDKVEATVERPVRRDEEKKISE